MRSTQSPFPPHTAARSRLFLLDWTIALFSAKPFSCQQLKFSPTRTAISAYGGMFVPETLMSALNDLAAEYERAKNDRVSK